MACEWDIQYLCQAETWHFILFLFIHFPLPLYIQEYKMFSKIRTVKEEVERAKYSKLVICQTQIKYPIHIEKSAYNVFPKKNCSWKPHWLAVVNREWKCNPATRISLRHAAVKCLTNIFNGPALSASDLEQVEFRQSKWRGIVLTCGRDRGSAITQERPLRAKILRGLWRSLLDNCTWLCDLTAVLGNGTLLWNISNPVNAMPCKRPVITFFFHTVF